MSSQSLLHNLDTQANAIIHKGWNRVAYKQQRQVKVSIYFLLSFRWLSSLSFFFLNKYDDLEGMGNGARISQV